MNPSLLPSDEHQDIRDAVRALCAGFDSRYWQQVDEARTYPEAFVDALTQAGWLAALIPTRPARDAPWARSNKGAGKDT